MTDECLKLRLDYARARALLMAMIRIRGFEDKCAELYSREKIRSILHHYNGEETAGVIPQPKPRGADGRGSGRDVRQGRGVCSAEIPIPYAQHLDQAAIPPPSRIVAAVEPQKDVIEIEAFEDGGLSEWRTGIGTKVPVGTPMLVIPPQDAAPSDLPDPGTTPEIPQPADPRPRPLSPELPQPQDPTPDLPAPEDPQPEPETPPTAPEQIQRALLHRSGLGWY
jgi:hypothetical protein